MNAEQKPGFLSATDTAVLVLRGDDAGEFLNGQVTNDVANLIDGDSKYALLLTPKGKIRAEMTIARDGDETIVVCSQDHLPTILKTIETFRIGYFFSVEEAHDQFNLVRLIAADPAAITGALTTPLVELESPLGIDLLVERSDYERLTEELLRAGATPIEADALDAAKVANGVPSFGAELNEDTFPAEAGLEARAVSFEKGCYVGQETVARMHYKGHPNRKLRILESREPLTRGAIVTSAEGRELGSVGTTASDPGGGNRALAILRREADTGDAVTAGEVSATIVEVPTPAASK